MRSDQVRVASIIAGNVVSTLEWLDGDSSETLAWEAAIAGLMHELVAVMPARFDGVLATAYNDYLATLPDQVWAGPGIETVGMIDRSMTTWVR